MEKIMDALREAGLADGIIIAIAITVIVFPVFWKLWKEAMSIRHASKKDKLQGVFQVLESGGLRSHPLQAELSFKELFGVRLTISEINYFLISESPLADITDYKYGRRYVDFEKDDMRIVTTRTISRLWWQNFFYYFLCWVGGHSYTFTFVYYCCHVLWFQGGSVGSRRCCCNG
ncbi:hypothetical protein DFO67_10682 [Modicisalibacter xianhensis]|uniref:Uncharacterized protein n=1 Tax=Modicisalibacter xianhensis TaxID=442341 RepID=A0A4R8FTQ6_9GAMM|nr:hypothetical protein DFO67_10682 [Halomonas xianhensis]